MYSKFKMRCICFFSYLIFRILTSTYRIKFLNEENIAIAEESHPNKSFIYALWHEHFFTAVASHRYRGISPMISKSNDGEIITYIGRKLGFSPVRGSTSKGGEEARKELYRRATAGLKAAFTVDGPRGPRHRLKSGVIDLARNTSMKIVPLAISADRSWILHKSWDHSMIPKPFSRVAVAYGKPISIDSNTHGLAFAEAKKQVTSALHEAKEMADSYV